MWARGVVVPPPSLDQDLGFPEIEEDFPRQQLVSELGVEALAVSILPRRAWFDVERLHADGLQPVTEGRGDELGAIIGSYVLGCPVTNEQLAQRVEDIPRAQLPLNPMARNSRVNSSITHNMRNTRPSWVRSCTKS